MLLAQGITIEPATGIGLVAALGTVIAALFKMLISEKNTRIADMEIRIKDLESVQKSYKEVADEGLKSATDTANYYRQLQGKPPIIPLAPVIPESHSPSTEKQRETAEIQTMRAKMAQVKLAMDQPVRPTPEHAYEPKLLVAGLTEKEVLDSVKSAAESADSAAESAESAVEAAGSAVEAADSAASVSRKKKPT